MAADDTVALKYLMCSKVAEEAASRGESVALKYLMCSRENGAIQAEDTVALKYLMCSKEADELIDGRKLFLAALLHQTLRYQIPDNVRATAIRLLYELGSDPTQAISSFQADDRSSFTADYLAQVLEVNEKLATMA